MDPLWRRRIGLVLIYGLILLGGHWGGIWLREHFQFDDANGHTPFVVFAIIAGVVLYAVLLAIPFVPGIEISLALLAALGRDIALTIYIASVVALMTSFLVGRLLPLSLLGRTFNYLGFANAADLMDRLAPLTSKERLALLMSAAPKRFVPTLIKYRYVAIAVLLNLPGNALVGGGGGIAMLAGISGLFATVPFLIVMAIAVIPIPLAAYFMSA